MSRWDIAGTDNRLLEQYKDSPNLKALLRALVDLPTANLRAMLDSFYLRLSVDASEGRQLDRIGDIVGAPRPLALRRQPIAFVVNGEVVVDEDGNVFAFEDPATPIDPMRDEDYRLFLKAIIYQNTSGSTIPEIEQFAFLLLGIPVSVLSEVGTVDLQFYETLNDAEQNILMDVFKVAAGIQARYFTLAAGPGAFGFDGGPNTGFDDTSGTGMVRIFERQL